MRTQLDDKNKRDNKIARRWNKQIKEIRISKCLQYHRA